jgi:hypothetical protein
MRGKFVAVAVVPLALAFPASASAFVRYFHSPNRNITCEVSAGGGMGTRTGVFCQSLQRPLSATLTRDGQVYVCSGRQCLGNTVRSSVRLKYGSSIRVGPFRCLSRPNGIRCVVVSTGHGFKINRNTVARF